MIAIKSPRFNADLEALLLDRQDIEADIEAVRSTILQLQQFPLIGEQYRGNIRRRFLPRLRAHLYYSYLPRAKRLELLRVWPAYRTDPFRSSDP